jgi:hypothetical protein
MGLSAPVVFAPFVRLELLAWDPLFGPRAGAPPRSAPRAPARPAATHARLLGSAIAEAGSLLCACAGIS